MRGVLKYALAAAILFATAIPAMARSYVVCLDEANDARFSSETVAPSSTPLFFTGAAPIYPANTVTSSATDCTPATLSASPIGTFFASGSFVGGLPGSIPADTRDGFYVIWHFRINGKGAFDTSGLTRSSPTYQQTITGSTNTDLSPVSGTAFVTNLTTGSATVLAFKITTPTNQ